MQPPLSRRGDNGPSDDVAGGLIERGGEAQHLVGRQDAIDVNRRERRLALRQRAGLVEDDDPDPGQRLERSTPFDEEPGLRAARHPAHDGDRDGEDQGAGGGHHQHGKRSQWITRGEPCPTGGGHRDGKE